MQDVLEFDMGNSFKSAAEAVRQDPVMVAFYAEQRLHALMDFIKKEKIFGEVTDYYIRKEFQKRGSVHFHIFLWIKDAPSKYRKSSQSDIVAYIDKCISTVIPADKSSVLHQLVKTKQMHSHTNTCSLSKKSKGCRFHFPRRECQETRLVYESEKKLAKHIFYETKRGTGDSFVNAYNPELLLRWLANMDIQFVSCETTLAYYVAKYITKAEPCELKTALTDTMKIIDEKGNLSKEGQMFRMGFCMLKTRIMSAQEAAYRICHLPLVESSRAVIKLNTTKAAMRLRKLRNKATLRDLSEESTDVFEDDILTLYRDRPEQLENLSLYKFASWYEKCGETVKRAMPSRSSDRHVRKKGKFSCIRNNFVADSTDDYYHNLLLLHLPHRRDIEIQQGYESAEEAFLAKEEFLDTENAESDKFVSEIVEAAQKLRLCALVTECDDGEDTESEEDICDDNLWMNGRNYEDERIGSDSGNIEPGIDTDPLLFDPQQNTESNINWQSLSVGNCSMTALFRKLDCLTIDQKRVMRYCHMTLLGDKAQMLLYVGGNAGTGKSFLAKVFIEWCRLINSQAYGWDSVIVCAPTGLAAKSIKGHTIHSVFHLPLDISGSYVTLNGRTLEIMKKELGHKKVLFIDEISMVSARILIWIHRRLQEIHHNTELFGGVSVFFTGDFLQLKPVKGSFAFKCSEIFDKLNILWLDKNERQKDDLSWCRILDNSRIGRVTAADCKQLRTRCFTAEELVNVTAIRLYPLTKMVNAFNDKEQLKLNSAFFENNSVNLYGKSDIDAGCLIADDKLPEKDRDAGGLPRCLRLSIGTRVMLVRSIGEGLVNGSMGFVHQILAEGGKIKKIYVKFDDIDSGISFKDPNFDNCIPIREMEVEYKHGGRYKMRRQFPLIPAWAVTIHKAQGLTMDEAVVNIKHCFEAGQAYVALSRICTMNGLHIETTNKQKELHVSKVYPNETALQALVGFRAKFLILKKDWKLRNYKVKNWLTA